MLPPPPPACPCLSEPGHTWPLPAPKLVCLTVMQPKPFWMKRALAYIRGHERFVSQHAGKRCSRWVISRCRVSERRRHHRRCRAYVTCYQCDYKADSLNEDKTCVAVLFFNMLRANSCTCSWPMCVRVTVRLPFLKRHHPSPSTLLPPHSPPTALRHPYLRGNLISSSDSA